MNKIKIVNRQAFQIEEGDVIIHDDVQLFVQNIVHEQTTGTYVFDVKTSRNLLGFKIWTTSKVHAKKNMTFTVWNNRTVKGRQVTEGSDLFLNGNLATVTKVQRTSDKKFNLSTTKGKLTITGDESVKISQLWGKTLIGSK